MNLRRMLDAWESEGLDLSTPLSVSSSFRFPLQHERARRDVLWGAGLLLFLPGIGWLLNMGHRIRMVHRMHHGEDPWPSWHDYPGLLRDGTLTFLGMVMYYTPGLLLGCWKGWAFGVPWLVLATIAIPGYMTHYCKHLDPREIFNPVRAFSRCLQGGADYWKAWGIALRALAVSFLGLPFGLGFLVSSVWFWQVAGFSFATVFTDRFALADPS